MPECFTITSPVLLAGETHTAASDILPGLYEVQSSSSDSGHSPGYQTGQTTEVWSADLVGSSVSLPVSPDLPDDVTYISWPSSINVDGYVTAVVFRNVGTSGTPDSVLPSVTFCPAPPVIIEYPPSTSPVTSEAPPVTSEAPPVTSEAPPVTSEAPPVTSEAPTTTTTTTTSEPTSEPHLAETGVEGAGAMALLGLGAVLVGVALAWAAHKKSGESSP
jgi:hypothetical protein